MILYMKKLQVSKDILKTIESKFKVSYNDGDVKGDKAIPDTSAPS